MATVTVKSASDANLSRTWAYESKNTHVRDASFSSCLSSMEETFILNLAELTPNPSPTITGTQEPRSHYQISLGRKKTDGEINVFGAERYFNGGMDEDTPGIVEKVAAKQHQRDERPNLQFVKPKIKHGTRSTCSEVSWNSQSGLLRSLFRDQSPNKQNKSQGKRFFANFGCNCSCSDKKSIDVDANNSRSNVNNEGFPVKEMIRKESTKIDQGPIDLVGIRVKQIQFKEDMHCEKFDKLRLSVVGVEEEEKPRKSLDVFGSPIRDLELNHERGLNMLILDAISKIKDNPATSGSSGNGIYELDMESDTSSDLFEIESLTGNPHRCLTRQASDSMSSCVTHTCYEPSEASIDWSVVTASAANFSTFSDHEERGSVSSALKNSNTISTETTKPTSNNITKTRTTSISAKERRPSLLSGCRSHKAVTVAADAYNMYEKRNPNSNPNTGKRQGLTDPLAPIVRFQAETKAIDIESANRKWGSFTTRPSLPKSKLARASHFLYMH